MKVLNELFTSIYKGNEDAIRLSTQLWDLAQTWDDLYDGDPISRDAVNKAFTDALFMLPANPLYGPDIQANLLNVYLRWQDANIIESSNASDNELAKAWMLRAGIYDLFVLIAAKLYGLAWATKIGPTVRKMYGETLEDYIEEMRNA